MIQLHEQFVLALMKVTAFVQQLWHKLKMVVYISLSLHTFYKTNLVIFTEFIIAASQVRNVHKCSEVKKYPT